jgi:hypothetical protein
MGIVDGFLITDRDFMALATALAFVVGAVALSALVVPRPVWRQVLPLIAFATLLRAAAAVVLYDGLVAAGRGGFVTGDDAAYADLSSRLARILHNDPAPFNYGAESYLLGTFVYVETAVFYLLGPKVLIVELLNVAMGGMLIAFVYDIGRRLFADASGGMIAAVFVSVYPSLVLWSALNLKDSLALLIIAIVLWLVLLFHTRRNWWLVVAPFAPLLAMESLRGYIFIGLALVVPASIALAPGRRLGDRAITSVTALALAALLLTMHFIDFGPAPPAGLAGLESQRIGMGIGANTSFTDVPVVQVETATTYVITSASASASPSAGGSPAPTPQVVVVAPGTRLALITDPLAPSPSPGVVLVRPGDIVVVGGAGATPAAVDQRKPLSVGPSTGTVELASGSDNGSIIRTLRYLPRGLAFVLLAPFPWSVSRALDLLPVPEMLLWYVALASALITTIRHRQTWRMLAPLVLFVGGTLLVFILAEGNIGTLFRHRAMVVPFVLILASPGFAFALRATLGRKAGAAAGVLSVGGKVVVDRPD